MRHATHRIAQAVAAPFRQGQTTGWTWRHALTLLLLAVTVPVFIAGALVAALVAAPLILVVGVIDGLQRFSPLSASQHPFSLR